MKEKSWCSRFSPKRLRGEPIALHSEAAGISFAVYTFLLRWTVSGGFFLRMKRHRKRGGGKKSAPADGERSCGRAIAMSATVSQPRFHRQGRASSKNRKIG